jgi:hypothetical protein
MKKRTTPRSIPPRQGTLTYHKPLMDLSQQEAITWIQGVRARLEHKMQRERAYLDRRAARGTHTPTDDAYEEDQVLETELLAILDELTQGLIKEQNP